MTPGFALTSQSASVSEAQLEPLAEALALYWQDLEGPWELPPTQFMVDRPPADWVPVIFTDVVTMPGDLAFHDTTGASPSIIVQVPVFGGRGLLLPSPGSDTCIAIAVSHEVAETACDPLTNLVMPYANGRTVALEVADPFQDNFYLKTLKDGSQVAVSDFALPSWFDHDATAGAPQDWMGLCTTPGEIVNGYAVVYGGDGSSSEVFGERPPGALLRSISRRRQFRLGRKQQFPEGGTRT